MVWDITRGNRTVTVVMNGGIRTEEYSGSTTVEEALRDVAAKYSLRSIIVEDSHGEAVEPEQGEEPLNSVGNLTVRPKLTGAA
jgi:3-deoxy-D-arabino-heptulosonate 7-phosphate (DAHP) synthase